MKYSLFFLTVLSISLMSCDGAKQLTTTPSEDIKEIPCIDESKINPNAACTKEYAPVCGCNGQTYPNKCFAEKSGVTSWANGECKSDNKERKTAEACIDPSAVQYGSGDCQKTYKPVCGCDGNTYTNECLAKRSGLKRYTTGKCGENCIDASKISNTGCSKEYNPVCGCNGVTYGNKCMAKNAGLLSWKRGKCEKK